MQDKKSAIEMNGKSTRISLNWWILYVHYNLKFKAVGFSVPYMRVRWGGEGV